MIQKINKFKPIPNSFKKTFCVFYEKNLEEINQLTVDFESESGSKYYYTESGMYRYSNHWGRLANSKWRLVENGLSQSKFKLGFAQWDEFYPDNNDEVLYYLEYNSVEKTITYQHKNGKGYEQGFVVRTAPDTMKRIKLARNILTLTNWANYFENRNIEELRVLIIHELIYTNKSIDQIKRELL
ncbi:MAG: hypothetical protein V4670_01130 [Bacteroidota bacterium]